MMIVLIVTEMDEVRSDNELISLIANILLVYYILYILYTVYMAMQHFFQFHYGNLRLMSF